jgi:hypothetical protein
MAPYGLIVISLCLAVLTVALRRVHGPTYWIVAPCVIGLSIGIMGWASRGTESPISTGRQAMAVIFLWVVPISLGFATANARALRARPWLVIVVVPLVFLAAVWVDMVVGVTLDILQP